MISRDNAYSILYCDCITMSTSLVSKNTIFQNNDALYSMELNDRLNLTLWSLKKKSFLGGPLNYTSL